MENSTTPEDQPQQANAQMSDAQQPIDVPFYYVRGDEQREAKLKLAISEMRPESLAVETNRTIERPRLPDVMARPVEPPWALQQFFNGQIDLDVELSKRYPSMPMLSIMQKRPLGEHPARRVCTLSVQDGAASLHLDADLNTRVVHFSFTLSGMLTLRFTFDALSDADRRRWLELMRREEGGLAFLWGRQRWESDYLICISRRHHTSLYAFSPAGFDAGVRLTAQITRQMVDWLEDVWTQTSAEDDPPPPLLTW
jgi:hypothetical protein